MNASETIRLIERALLYIKSKNIQYFLIIFRETMAEDKNYSVSRIQMQSPRGHRIMCWWSKVALHVRFNKCAIPHGKIANYYYVVSDKSLQWQRTWFPLLLYTGWLYNFFFISLSFCLFLPYIILCADRVLSWTKRGIKVVYSTC